MSHPAQIKNAVANYRPVFSSLKVGNLSEPDFSVPEAHWPFGKSPLNRSLRLHPTTLRMAGGSKSNLGSFIL
jgi:hypothetical protein